MSLSKYILLDSDRNQNLQQPKNNVKKYGDLVTHEHRKAVIGLRRPIYVMA